MGIDSFLFGPYGLPNGLPQPLILKRFLHFCQELLFLPAADLYFRAVAHNNDAALAPYVFFYMQQVDEKRFVHA
jgi:hypothetical protein